MQKEWKQKEDSLPNNIIGMYPHEALFGRLTFSYERLFASKSLGILIPFSATYNILQNAKNSKTNAPINNSKGIGIITGLDVNYYYDLKPTLKYFFGPRFRYGTHMTLGAVEGFNFQLQNGLLKSKGKYFTNTFAMGVGFFKLSQKYANYPGYDPKLIIPWASFTWRLGFRL